MSELLTVRDVAMIIKCSEDAVTKIFAKMDGVIDLGRAETRHKRVDFGTDPEGYPPISNHDFQCLRRNAG
jgi:hypothetical protein